MDQAYHQAASLMHLRMHSMLPAWNSGAINFGIGLERGAAPTSCRQNAMLKGQPPRSAGRSGSPRRSPLPLHPWGNAHERAFT